MEARPTSRDLAHWDSPWAGSHKFQRLLADQVRPRLEYICRVSPSWQDQRVLDLGCGVGFMAEALAKRGARVIGVDPSAVGIATAKAHAQSEGLEIEYREGAGETIPLPPDSVDRVICVDVLEHVEDLEKVIAEVRRVLRRGGLFFFDTINRNRLSTFMVVTLMEDILKVIPKGGHDPRKFVCPEELDALLRRNRFTDVTIEVGMGIVGLNRHLEFRTGLTRSTKVMYIGHAR